MDEVREIILYHATAPLVENPEAHSAVVRFIHKYADGSGETEVEDILTINRVEVDIQ